MPDRQMPPMTGACATPCAVWPCVGRVCFGKSQGTRAWLLSLPDVLGVLLSSPLAELFIDKLSALLLRSSPVRGETASGLESPCTASTLTFRSTELCGAARRRSKPLSSNARNDAASNARRCSSADMAQGLTAATSHSA